MTGIFSFPRPQPRRVLPAWSAALVLLSTAVLPAAPPQGLDRTFTLNEDTPWSLTSPDFGFNDPGDLPAHGFTRVRISSLPAAGMLRLDGEEVQAGTYVSQTPVPGIHWSARGGLGVWQAVASSADGMTLAAVEYGPGEDRIQVSLDGGTTWTPRATVQNWYDIAISADGTKLAAVSVGGPISPRRIPEPPGPRGKPSAAGFPSPPPPTGQNSRQPPPAGRSISRRIPA